MFSHLKTFKTHAASQATAATFAASGSIFGAWAAMIPFIKEKFQLDEAQLGILLLALPIGVTLMNPFSVPLLHRFGAARLSSWMTVASASLFVLPVSMPTVWLCGCVLFVAGAAFSTLNVAMNTCASQIEQVEKLKNISACHGFWSAGAWLGSAVAGLALGLGATHFRVVFVQAILLTLVAFLIKENLKKVPDDPHHEQAADAPAKGFSMPNAALWVLISISLCTNLTEGTMNDWSAVFLREVVGTSESLASWGFSSYAFCMAAGRFLGDGIIARFGDGRALRGCGIIAATGFLLPIFFQNVPASLLGFGMIGAGVSLGAPILYASAARVPGMAKGAGLAVLNTFAMLGFLGGPAAIGFLAKIFSLPMAFGMVALAVCFWIFQTRKI